MPLFFTGVSFSSPVGHAPTSPESILLYTIKELLLGHMPVVLRTIVAQITMVSWAGHLFTYTTFTTFLFQA